MPDWESNIDELIIKYLQQTLTGEEKTALGQWVAASAGNQQLFDKLVNEAWITSQLKNLYAYDEEAGWQKIKAAYSFGQGGRTAQVRKMKWQAVAAAAAILLILLTGAYFLFVEKKARPGDIPELAQNREDVPAPVSNRATIKLADGSTLYMDSAVNGELALQGNVKLIKQADGQISYEKQNADGTQQTRYNTLANPRGSGVIDIKLSDGTHVWLNAGSSLTYPVAFTGEQRSITMTGEAYFEVAHDSRRPFKVNKADMQVTVLGTHFNVNAYDDEPEVKVTLLEGSVNVSRQKKTLLLKPGEQAKVNSKLEKMVGVDTDAVIAWKNGYFSFDGQDVNAMLRQLARWYNIEIVMESAVPDTKLAGGMARNTSLSQVLKILETMKIKFTIDGRKLIIRK